MRPCGIWCGTPSPATANRVLGARRQSPGGHRVNTANNDEARIHTRSIGAATPPRYAKPLGAAPSNAPAPPSRNALAGGFERGEAQVARIIESKWL